MQVVTGGFRLPKKPRTAAWWTLTISVLALALPATALGAGPARTEPTASPANRASVAAPTPARATRCSRWEAATATAAVLRSYESCSVIWRRGAIRPVTSMDSSDRVRDTQWSRSKRRTACRSTASWVQALGPR
jgi:hypothetical protein